MRETATREQGLRIEERLFGRETEADDISIVISNNRATLVNRIEGMPETSPDPDEETRHVLIESLTIRPATLILGHISCKRVRFAASNNRTYAAVRVDVPYTGNGDALRWKAPDDMLEASRMYVDKEGRPGCVQQYWSILPDEFIVSFYAVLPSSGGDSERDAEETATALAPRIQHVIDVLESMQRIAEAWNRSMPFLIDEIVTSRQAAIAKREAFLRAFRLKVSSLLLLS